MIVAVPREVAEQERRVALSPESCAKLVKLGFQVQIETQAGERSCFSDASYQAAGAKIVSDVRALWQAGDLILKVHPPQRHPQLQVDEAELCKPGAVLISFIWPAKQSALLEKLAARNVSTLAMDAVPRISRAQKLDALSSMANIAGYRAVIEAAQQFGGFFTGQITAAGKVPPAKVLVIGAGVAGLAAIGTAKALGAIVRAFDTRPAVREQVQSMGAEFLELSFEEDGSGAGGYAKTMSPEFIRAEMALFAQQARDVDIIITTALIPGKSAPILLTADLVRSMRQGSIIVDLAAEQGGNCELTRPGHIVCEHGVTIIGLTDLPSRLPTQASRLYANNVAHFIDDLRKAAGQDSAPGSIRLDLNDEVVRGSLVTHAGAITWPPPVLPSVPASASALSMASSASAAASSVATTTKLSADLASTSTKSSSHAARAQGHGHALAKPMPTKRLWFYGIVSATILAALGRVAPADFMQHLTVFILSCFIGWQLVWNVTPALHTPLMSVTNAISGIIVIGAMLQVRSLNFDLSTGLAILAVLLAMINIAGGFLVTRRMLGMFRK